MQDPPGGRTPPVLEAGSQSSKIPKIRDLVGTFLVALKNHAFYPEDHAICRKSVTALHTRLDAFLAEYDFLHLDVEEDRFLFEDNVLHQAPPQNDYLPSQLFRDGIQWLEFHSGITEVELSTFFKLVIRYRTLKEEAEGDLVTALWEAGLTHLRYKKEEVLWKAEPLIDFSLFKVSSRGTPTANEEERESPVRGPEIMIPDVEPAFWKLTPEEHKTLRDMVIEEEARDYTEDALEVLAIILNEQRNPQDFAVILDFLAEEFSYALAQGEFHFVLKFLESFDAMRDSVASEEPWAISLLDEFRRKISSPEVLGSLEQAWPAVSVMDADRREELRQALLWFPADVVFTLGNMLESTDYPVIEHLLTEIIGIHAGRDLRQISQLLETAKEPLILKLVPLLKEMDGRHASELLFGLTRHPSSSVCSDAINALLARDSQNLKRLFPLIQDSRPPVRSLIFQYIGRRRNPLGEDLLLHHFEKNRGRLEDRRHILACYRALGQCGSARSIPLLQDTLLKRDWKLLLGIGKSIHRMGAALALLGMPNDKTARAVLESAARSSFSAIRTAYRQAVEEKKHGKIVER